MKYKIILSVLRNKKIRRIILLAIFIPIFLIFAVLASPFAILFSVISDDGGGVQISAMDYMSSLNAQFIKQIDHEVDDGTADEYKIIYNGSDGGSVIDNSLDVLMVFSVLENERNKKQVLRLSGADVVKLRNKYFQMNYINTSYKEQIRTKKVKVVTKHDDGTKSVSYKDEEYEVTIKTIIVTSLSADEMKRVDNFSQKEVRVLNQLINSSVFYGGLNYLTNEDIKKIRDKIGDRKITGDDIVKMAKTLEGRVKYFWGGKYDKKGINPNWGKPRKVTSLGSKSTGTIRPYGLDCSGYVTWVFINLDMPLEVIGHGARNQNAKCVPVAKEYVKAGDFAFLTPTGRKHIGIVTGFDTDGEVLVIHESSSINNVAVSRASDIGFKYFKRHAILLDE